MDRDRVNEVLYNRPYDSLYNRCFGWLGLWAEWKHVLEYGADALRCTDGQILRHPEPDGLLAVRACH